MARGVVRPTSFCHRLASPNFSFVFLFSSQRTLISLPWLILQRRPSCLMSRVAMQGSYTGIPASIIVDGGLEQSRVSSDFAINNGIPRTVCVSSSVTSLSGSGPVVIPSSRSRHMRGENSVTNVNN